MGYKYSRPVMMGGLKVRMSERPKIGSNCEMRDEDGKLKRCDGRRRWGAVVLKCGRGLGAGWYVR